MISQKTAVDLSREQKKKNRLAAISVVLTLLACLLMLIIRAANPTLWTYRFHRQNLTAVVAQIKAAQIPIDKPCFFQVARSLDPTTVRHQDSEGDENSIYKIGVLRRGSEDYLITIELDDQGHLGMYGLLYSDSPLNITGPAEGPGRVEEALLLPFVKQQLSARWWYAYNDLY